MHASKINTLGKKLAFSAPEVCLALSFVSINSWLLYYFVNIIEMPALLAGIAFLVGRLADAILDPFIGQLSDKIQHRYGRKGFIAWGLIPAALTYVGIWYLPSLANEPVTQFGLAAFAFVAFSLFYTLISIPRHAMLPSLIPDYDQRTQQVSFNISFVMLAVLIGIAITPALVLYFAQQGDLATTPVSAWYFTAAVYSLLGIIFFLPFVLTIPDTKGKEQKASTRNLLSEFISVFHSAAFRSLIIISTLGTLATLIVQSMLPFYLESVIKLPGDQQQSMLGAIFVLSILSFPIWAFVGQRIGKAPALICGMIIYIVFLSMTPFIPRTGASTTLYLAAVLSGIGISALNLFPFAMLPDTVDADTLNNGGRREGLVSAAYVFMQKCAGSVGVFSNAIVLSLFDHRPGQIVQEESTLNAFVWMTGPLPLVLLLIAIWVCLKYPLTKSSHQHTQAQIAKMESL